MNDALQSYTLYMCPIVLAAMIDTYCLQGINDRSTLSRQIISLVLVLVTIRIFRCQILFAHFSGRPDDLKLRDTSGILDLNKLQA